MFNFVTVSPTKAGIHVPKRICRIKINRQDVPKPVMTVSLDKNNWQIFSDGSTQLERNDGIKISGPQSFPSIFDVARKVDKITSQS